jgi:hypothetical protein
VPRSSTTVTIFTTAFAIDIAKTVVVGCAATLPIGGRHEAGGTGRRGGA